MTGELLRITVRFLGRFFLPNGAGTVVQGLPFLKDYRSVFMKWLDRWQLIVMALLVILWVIQSFLEVDIYLSQLYRKSAVILSAVVLVLVEVRSGRK